MATLQYCLKGKYVCTHAATGPPRRGLRASDADVVKTKSIAADAPGTHASPPLPSPPLTQPLTRKCVLHSYRMLCVPCRRAVSMSICATALERGAAASAGK